MKANQKNIFLVLIIIIFISGGYMILQRNHEQTAVHADIYYCPMHPNYTSPKPGVCPICQMKLVKKELKGQEAKKEDADKICLLHNCPKVHDGQPCPMTVVGKKGEALDCPFCKKHLVESSQKKAEKEILYWTDPMIPGFKADGPGKSPMGMDLVPVYKHAQGSSQMSQKESISGYSVVSLNAEKRQLIGIKTVSVIKKPLVKTIHAYGYVAHDLELYEAQLEYIYAWHDYYPYLSRRPVRGEYQLDWRDYYKGAASEGRFRSDEKTKAQQRLIKAEYELVHLGLTEAQLQQLREVKYGQPWIQPELVFMDEGQPKWVYAQIFESDLGFVDVGQKVKITIPAYNETTQGIVRSVAPIIDSSTRTMRVRIQLPDYKGELSVNMFVNVDMPVELDSSLMIPREAVMDTGMRKVVFVEREKGVFEPRNVQTGFEGDGMVAVTSGLKEGETVVASGNFLLDSESRLQSSIDGGDL